MKRLLIAVAVVCALVAAVLIFMPNLRQTLFGVQFKHHLQVGRAEEVTTIAQILCGSEIRPVSVDGNVLPDPEVNPDIYDVRFSAQESVQSVGSEEVLNYSVDAINSEQFGQQGAGKMVGNEYRLRLSPLGLPVSFDRQKGDNSRIIDDLRFTQIMGAWWPGFPEKRLRKGDSWTARWTVPMVSEILDGKVIPLQHNLEYFLEDIKAGNGANVAVITSKGTIEPAAVEGLPENVRVEGTGSIAGKAYINVATGQTVVADEREIWSVVVRLLDEDMEVVQFADRNSRTYRPRLLPHGDAGFEQSAPQPTGANGMPQAGQLMQDKSKNAPKAEAPKAQVEAPKAQTEAPKAQTEAPKTTAEAPKTQTEAPKALD